MRGSDLIGQRNAISFAGDLGQRACGNFGFDHIAFLGDDIGDLAPSVATQEGEAGSLAMTVASMSSKRIAYAYTDG